MPVIVYDAEKGFHTFSSIESMEQAGGFVYFHHKIAYKENPEHAVTFDASITSLVCFQWIAIILLLGIFFKVGRRYKKSPEKAPHGLQNMIEAVVVYLKNDVIKPNIGGDHIADRLEHYFYALFFFILFMNLIGLVPGGTRCNRSHWHDIRTGSDFIYSYKCYINEGSWNWRLV